MVEFWKFGTSNSFGSWPAELKHNFRPFYSSTHFELRSFQAFTPPNFGKTESTTNMRNAKTLQTNIH